MSNSMRSGYPDRSVRSRQGRSTSSRWDIQGLRAFAVLAVILDHLTGWPGGGFVGVDVFFVISGFLITGLLLREHDKTGHISFTGFYRRRIRRIIPAASLVLLVTGAASYYAFNAVRFKQTLIDEVCALFFGANWRFESLATNYFDANRPVSPVQHFWSLSVEEQFYFVWPWLMLAIFAFMLRSNRSSRHATLVVGAAIGVITAGSLAWAFAQSSSSPNTAYFSSFTRVWELGVGAVLAVLVPVLTKIPDAIRPVLAWVGLAAMVASLWVINESTTFPAPGALLPVAGAGLVLASGTYADHRRQQPYFWPLTNPVSGYVGDISYSLYLWHFPIIIITLAVTDDTTLTRWLIAAGIAACSIYAYHLVENPIRRSEWLEPRSSRRRSRGHSRRLTIPEPPRWWQITFLSGLILMLVVMCAVALRPVTPSAAPPILTATSPLAGAPSSPASPAIGDVTSAEAPLQASLTNEIISSVQAASWPAKMNPTMDEIVGAHQAPADVSRCGMEGKFVDVKTCTWGNPAPQARTAAIIGDSMSMTYVNPLRIVLSKQGQPWRITTLGTFGCPFRDVPARATAPDCAGRKRDAVNKINQIKPDILFVVDSYWPQAFKKGGQPPLPSDWTAHLSDALSQVSRSVGKIVLIAPPPGEVSPEECYTRGAKPADCLGKVPENWTHMRDAETQLAAQIGGQWVDSSSWFCADGYCPIFVGTTPVRSDLNHMSIQYAERIAPVIGEAFSSQGVLKASPAAAS
ncbi:acyltransferase family protein [Nocardioides sp. AN3]